LSGSLRIVNKGIQALVEDWPGRTGYYKFGYSISGAADHLAHRLANLLVGNEPGEAGLEIAGGMLVAQFESDTTIAITGANLQPSINDKPVSMWRSIPVKEGDVIRFTFPKDFGFRAYLAFSGGIDVPEFFGSRSTCIYGRYGGFQGRPLEAGDTLKIGRIAHPDRKGRRVRLESIPRHDRTWEVRMVPGPTCAPEYVTEEGMDRVYSTSFRVDRNADRSGYRLVTPHEIFPDSWARETGGVAGKHSSNIVDMGYTLPGGLNVSGDQIIVLGPDGPCGGGFVTIGMVMYADVWKVFQAIPGKDTIRFVHATIEEAEASRKETEDKLRTSVVEEE
jgi:biotin-dependent carboxylase-like uncharacterized protein